MIWPSRALSLGSIPAPLSPDDPRLAQTVWGLTFRNPVGMAAGFDKDARVFAPLLATGFGFVEIGTLTPKPQKGNPSPRIFRSAADGAIINRLGFNNEGQAAALPRLSGRRNGVVGVNIGAGKDSEDRIGDYVSGIARMSPVADYLTINISSPNTPGLRDLQAPEALAALLARVQEARGAAEKRPPLLVKLAPDIADSDLPEIVRVIQAHGVDGIVVSNTTLSRDGLKDRRLRRGDRRPLGAPAVRPRHPHARPGLQTHGGEAAADRRWRHRFWRCGRRQDQSRRFAAPALHRPRVRRAEADRRHKASAAEGDAGGKTDNLSSLVGRDAARWTDREF